MKRILSFTIVVVVGILFYNLALKAPSFDRGELSPDISAQLIDGTDFRLQDLRGQYVLIDFWGSWCGPCRRDFPHLRELHNAYHGKKFNDALGFEIVSIALEKSDKNTLAIIQKENLSWKHHIIDVAPAVLLSPLARNYDIKELPTTFLLNPDGEFMGTDLPYDEIKRILKNRLVDQ